MWALTVITAVLAAHFEPAKKEVPEDANLRHVDLENLPRTHMSLAQLEKMYGEQPGLEKEEVKPVPKQITEMQMKEKEFEGGISGIMAGVEEVARSKLQVSIDTMKQQLERVQHLRKNTDVRTTNDEGQTVAVTMDEVQHTFGDRFEAVSEYITDRLAEMGRIKQETTEKSEAEHQTLTRFIDAQIDRAKSTSTDMVQPIEDAAEAYKEKANEVLDEEQATLGEHTSLIAEQVIKDLKSLIHIFVQQYVEIKLIGGNVVNQSSKTAST